MEKIVEYILDMGLGSICSFVVNASFFLVPLICVQDGLCGVVGVFLGVDMGDLDGVFLGHSERYADNLQETG